MGVRVQREDFDTGAEIKRLTAGRTDIGAIVTFTGTVRSGGDRAIERSEFIAGSAAVHSKLQKLVAGALRNA